MIYMMFGLSGDFNALLDGRMDAFISGSLETLLVNLFSVSISRVVVEI